MASHAVLAISAPLSVAHPAEALFDVGGVALLLLFIGIHNARDTVAFHVFDGPGEMEQGRDEQLRTGATLESVEDTAKT